MEIILHTEEADGHFSCEGFAGFPAREPVWIVLSCCGKGRLQSLLQQLRHELLLELFAMAPGLKRQPPMAGCPGRIDSPTRSCHVSQVHSQARKLLVLIADAADPISVTPLVSDWLAGRPLYDILPVYPRGVTALPPQLQSLQICSWNSFVAEAVPALLAACGLTDEHSRVFISYKRDHTRELADQLFEELSKYRFDVFLDRFRIAPAANFQTRLGQELADKAMVVVLESQKAAYSAWIRFEVSCARQ